jgi:hypothetical protein
MAKDAGERFSSCGELARAARNAASGAARRVDGVRPPAPAETMASPPAAPAPQPTGANSAPHTPVPVAAAAAAAPAPAAAAPPALPPQEPLTGEAPGEKKQWLTPMKQLLLTLLLVVLAAAASGAIVYFLTRDDGATTSSATGAATPAIHPLAELVPSPVWQDCKETTPRADAVETAVCTQPTDATTFTPDRLELSTFASGAAVQSAYEALRRSHHVARNQGRCTGLSWTGEGTWLHNPASPGVRPAVGGSRFCYFDGSDVVIVWTHRKFGQPTHTDLLAVAREGGSDHPGLYGWWRFWHHRIGKVFS